MKYVDGFVLPVKDIKEYKRLAKICARIWKKHGALEYFECVEDEMYPDTGNSTDCKILPFPKLVKPKKGEKLVFAFIVYKNKKHRNEVNKRVMKDPKMQDPNWTKKMPFEIGRMSWGGFKAIVEA